MYGLLSRPLRNGLPVGYFNLQLPPLCIAYLSPVSELKKHLTPCKSGGGVMNGLTLPKSGDESLSALEQSIGKYSVDSDERN